MFGLITVSGLSTLSSIRITRNCTSLKKEKNKSAFISEMHFNSPIVRKRYFSTFVWSAIYKTYRKDSKARLLSPNSLPIPLTAYVNAEVSTLKSGNKKISGLTEPPIKSWSKMTKIAKSKLTT
jgi:hypothetical protein